jgi:hypothetical protein
MIQSIRRLLIAVALAFLPMFSVTAARADEAIRVGIMSAEDEDVWAVVAEQAKTKVVGPRLRSSPEQLLGRLRS